LYLRPTGTAIDASHADRDSLSGRPADAAALGRSLAAVLLDRGAAALMAVPE
jgi:hydroxymethylbilane synthase